MTMFYAPLKSWKKAFTPYALFRCTPILKKLNRVIFPCGEVTGREFAAEDFATEKVL